MSLLRGVGECLFSESEITSRCKELAQEVDFFYSDLCINEKVYGDAADGADLPTIAFMPVLNGAMQVSSLLLNYCYPFYVHMHPVFSKAYPVGTTRLPEQRIFFPEDLETIPERVLVIEDIIDTGHTTTALVHRLLSRGKQVAVCSLLRKTQQLKTPHGDIKHFIGFHCPDEFVVGFGMDYNGSLRNLSGIHIFHEDRV